MDNKDTGSFYTPKSLVKYMVGQAIKNNHDIKILEPSFGDGRFIDELLSYGYQMDAVEMDMEKVQLYKNKEIQRVNLFCSDFVQFSLECKDKYQLIIGNPPYIGKKKLKEAEREKSHTLLNQFGLSNQIFQNLWVSFVLGALKLLDVNGTIFFVLPFEFLQVQYAEKLRNFLEEKFNYIEITTFQESVFPDTEQDVCLVYMTNESDIEPIVKYRTVVSGENFTQKQYSEIKRNKPISKWSNSILNDDEIELLGELSKNCVKISEIGFSSPGIVTGANNFFIIDNAKVIETKSKNNVLPIIQKSSFISSKIVFDVNDFNKLNNANNKVWLLNLAEVNKINKNLKKYIRTGEESETKGEEICNRYKCKKRKRWHDVPIISYGDLMFFKRYNIIPKYIVNEAQVYTTDIAYNTKLKKEYDKYSMIFCFYNSLTMALCEYNGRFYGGGVGELVPSEFKALRIPYKKITKEQFDKLQALFEQKDSIENIIDYVDSIVFNDIDKEKFKKLKTIREKYLFRRIKKNT